MRTDTYQDFRTAYPLYDTTSIVDEIREREYPLLAREHLAYLDYTGSGLPSLWQIREHLDWLIRNVYGNPHSTSLPALRSTEAIEETREAILRFFGADPEEYVVVFTQNATGALRLLGESFPFDGRGELLITADNHNSVLGLREFARRQHTPVRYLPITREELRADDAAWRHHLDAPGAGGARLFAYPAQSNFSGVQHDLRWVSYAQERGWLVLLDAAAFVPTNRLNLSEVHPDFVPLSFYKMFGYPTWVGCLISRREAMARLVRPWFSGGTVLASSLAADTYAMLPAPAGFEDGTADFLNIPAVGIGLSHLNRLGMDRISLRTKALLAWTLEEMQALRHRGGQPVVRVLGPKDSVAHGPTVAFRVLAPDGTPHDERLILREANAAGLVLRSGCFCNPGAGETALDFPGPRIQDAFHHAHVWHSIDDLVRWLGIPTLGVVRASFGAVSNFDDAARLIGFLGTFIDRPTGAEDLPPRGGC